MEQLLEDVRTKLSEDGIIQKPRHKTVETTLDDYQEVARNSFLQTQMNQTFGMTSPTPYTKGESRESVYKTGINETVRIDVNHMQPTVSSNLRKTFSTMKKEILESNLTKTLNLDSTQLTLNHKLSSQQNFFTKANVFKRGRNSSHIGHLSSDFFNMSKTGQINHLDQQCKQKPDTKTQDTFRQSLGLLRTPRLK